MYILKTIGSIIAMMIGCKIVGVRQIAQITAYDYVSGITIGSIAASMCVDSSIEWYIPVVAILIYAVITRLIGLATSKSIFFRRVLTGKPTVIIEHGKINLKALKKHNYDVNDLLLECRIQGYFNIEDIESAIMETNGEISILAKPQKRPANCNDLKIPTSPESICVNIIIDGKILFNNLKSFGKEENWLKSKLKEQGILNEKQVLLAYGTPDGNLKVYEKQAKQLSDYFM